MDVIFFGLSKLESGGEKIILWANQRAVPSLLHELCTLHSGIRRLLKKIPTNHLGHNNFCLDLIDTLIVGIQALIAP